MYPLNRSINKQLAPGLILGTIVLIGLLLLGDMNQVGERLLHFHWSYFAFAIALSFFSHALGFLKRAINLQQSGIKKITLRESYRIFIASQPLTLTTSRFSDSFKGIWLHKITDIPVERAISIFFVDQITDNLCIFVLMVLGAIAFPYLWPLFLPFLVLFLAGIIYLKQKPNPASNSIIRTRMNEFIPQWRKCAEVNPTLFTAKNMIITFVIGVICWAAEGVALFVILIGLGLPPSLPLMAISVFVFAVATTLGMLTRMPAGLGVTELCMAISLTLVLHFQPEIAVLSTILFRFATFWIRFILGLLFWSASAKSLGLLNQEGSIIES